MSHKGEVIVRFFPTHRFPHPDELLARFLLELMAAGHFGPKGVPEIASNARFVEWGGPGSETPDRRSFDEWISEGYLPLGIGCENSPYNDHNRDKRTSAVPYCAECKKADKPRWCVSDMVAFDFQIMNDPKVRRLLAYVHGNNCHGHSSRFDFARLVAAEQRVHKRKAEEVYQDWRRLFLLPEFASQQQLFGPARAAFEKAGMVFTFQRKREDRPITHRVCVLDGADHPEATVDRVTEWARLPHGGNCDLVIQRMPEGSVQILVRPEARFQMEASAAVLRYLEHRAKPWMTGVSPTYEELAVAGECPLVSNWFFHAETGHIFNGNETHPDVMPTDIAFRTIVDVLTCLAITRAEEVRDSWSIIDALVERAFRESLALNPPRSKPKQAASPVQAIAAGLKRPHRDHTRRQESEAVPALVGKE